MSETIGYLLNDSARLFRRAFDARTRDTGITALQWRLITYLKRHEGIRQGPLAEREDDRCPDQRQELEDRQQRHGGLLEPEDFAEAADHRITTKVAMTAIIR